MAISYTAPDGTVFTTIADLANWYYQTRAHMAANPTNGELIVMVDRKPGTPIS